MISRPDVRPLRVLMADDMPEIRVLLRRCLQLDGFAQVVGEAADGEEAVRLAEDDQPDLVLLDLTMPMMDGLQAIPEILQRSPRSRIVMMSAEDASAVEARALTAGAAAFVSKSRGLDAILATVHEIARQDPGRGDTR